ncbi:MAG: glycosyltransferase family 4 protein [Chloroflexi bacterium]|nr:glycosyltransferase family 4 protein [Chloroflexota bacterium]
MKIALVVHDFDPRFGQGRYTIELARRLGSQYDVSVYANRFGIIEPNLTFRKVPAWRRTALTTILSFSWAAERLLRRRDYDLIHAQGLACWQADVITAHICNAARFRNSPTERWRKRLFPFVVVPLERRFYRQNRARHLLAVSHKVAEEISTCYQWSRARTVVYHGTDADVFSPVQNGEERDRLRDHFRLPGDSWVWLFVGEADKGLSLVLEQLPCFPRAVLLVISHANLASFQGLARHLGVDSRVRFHGPESDTSTAYRAADLFVYPSTYDAFGMVVAEAMATALPVIVGKDIGAAEWIISGENGLLCDPRQPASLRRQLEWLQAKPEKACELGRAARSTVLQFSWDKCAALTAGIYDELLANRSHP